jgi:hypothetical protein
MMLFLSIQAQPARGDILLSYSIVDYGGANESLFLINQFQDTATLQQFANLTLSRPVMYTDTPAKQGLYAVLTFLFLISIFHSV